MVGVNLDVFCGIFHYKMPGCSPAKEDMASLGAPEANPSVVLNLQN